MVKTSKKKGFYLNHMGYKGTVACLILKYIQRFYLNHMGYKESCYCRDGCRRFGFYLNHMGYKVDRIRICKVYFSGFIWTIWDIKFNAFKRLFIFITFYLNHMGYKDQDNDYSNNHIRSFIWTIWDIKQIRMWVCARHSYVLSEPYGI